MSVTDRTLTCRDCGTAFVFTASEQQFYASKGFTNDPARCPACRATRKAQRSGGGYAERSSMSAGRPQTEARETHVAVCVECGGEARVPFVPRGDRPVYCSTCFNKVRGQSYR